MTPPKIDPALLPGLEGAPGLYGSIANTAAAVTDDRTVIIMIFSGGVVPSAAEPD